MTGTADPGDHGARRRELAENLSGVRNRISAARLRYDAADVTLIVVTKFFPASDVAILADLGVSDVGENKDQEAAPKATAITGPDAFAGADDEVRPMRWHFIGQLQSNKTKSVVRYAHAVHSVDRPSLVKALSKAMGAEQARRQEAGLTARPAIRCFIQVNLEDVDDGAPQEAAETAHRGGADPHEVTGLADLIAASSGLEPAGVMAVAPLGADPTEAFSSLAAVSARLVQRHPDATGISAGMSHDLEQAIECGATHLRVGSDVLGPRPAVR